MNVTLYKAQPVSDQAPIEDLVIQARKPIPDGTLKDTMEIMRVDAIKLVGALRRTLPQGTWAHVVAEIARNWAADQAGIISAAQWGARE